VELLAVSAIVLSLSIVGAWLTEQAVGSLS
jgi:hypothetical protein